MPNVNAPSGLAPVCYRSGSPWNGQCRLYCVAAANTNAFYIGDPVKMDATNYADSNGIPCVTLGTAGATARGVIVAIGTAVPSSYQPGSYINPNDLSKISRPAGAQAVDYYVGVVDDPDVIFEIQEDTTSTPGQAAQMTKNANFIAGSPATGVQVSAFQLNSNTYNTTSTLNLKVMQAVQRQDNTPYTAYQKLLVTINNHDFSVGTDGY